MKICVLYSISMQKQTPSCILRQIQFLQPTSVTTSFSQASQTRDSKQIHFIFSVWAGGILLMPTASWAGGFIFPCSAVQALRG